jgi:exo-beta-1,3-glucanase (GH17 family)
MRDTPLIAMRQNFVHVAAELTGSFLQWMTALLFVGLVAACTAVRADAVSKPGLGLRPLSADFGMRKAVSYSPFRTAKNVADRDDEIITAAMIKQDLDLLLAGRFTLIRLFDSSDKVSRLTLQVIREYGLDMKVMLGIYVQHDAPAYNDAEIARGIALARAYKDIVVAVSVGNETMVSWSFNRFDTAAIKGLIDKVRNAIEQPVTTDDNWAFFSWNGQIEQDPAPVLSRIDFVSMHTYPLLDSVYSPHLWDWRQGATPPSRRAAAMADAAVARAKFEYAAVRSYMDSLGLKAMPIVIGETGWQADPATVPFRAHPVNQKMYVDRINAWQGSRDGPRTIFYFEAFDEPWKEADDKWGLFNVKRQARYVVQDLYPRAIWEPGDYTFADAAFVTPIEIRSTVTAKRYTLHAASATPGEARPVTDKWKVRDGSVAVRVDQTIEISPTVASSAWSVALPLPNNQADDLSAFAAGSLNFRIRTTYHRPIEVGFDVGSKTEGSAFAAQIPLLSGQFGYANDGAWHDVSIPIDRIRQYVAAQQKVGLSRIDLMRVTSPFVIADRHAASGAQKQVTIEIDRVHWAR